MTDVMMIIGGDEGKKGEEKGPARLSLHWESKGTVSSFFLSLK